MKTLQEYLADIAQWHQDNGTDIKESLKPGLSPEQIKAEIESSGFGFAIPISLSVVYGWSNGTDYLQLMPNFCMNSLSDALAQGASGSGRYGDEGSVKWLPILVDRHDEYSGTYYVQCSPKEYSDAPVFYFEYDIEESNEGETKTPELVFESVYSMIRSIAVCYKKGAIYYDDTELDEHPAQVKKWIRKCNPNLISIKRRAEEDFD